MIAQAQQAPVLDAASLQLSRDVFQQLAADMLGVLKTPPDPAAVARLSESPLYNSTMRTTCVATMVEAGMRATRSRSERWQMLIAGFCRGILRERCGQS